ncbi:hypothetical protein [Phytohalomonas tamaricis]|uniref:hypothetical protein n=1 Tax=Phytohalomonas tamaricis TaxID=2081032 RepID=UPI000D0B3741|nr:hypothetical protein [Phytohalomonas tamaricis]
MAAYSFRDLHAGEMTRALAFIEACFSEALSKEERSAIQAQLNRSLDQDHFASTHTIVCLSEESIIGIGLYFIDYSIVRNSKSLTIEDIYTPCGKEEIASALIRQLASVAVNEQCSHIEWSSWDYPFIEQFQLNANQYCNMAETGTYRLSGDALKALAGF